MFSLPIAGVIQIVLLIASRRTATMSQIQASLASINVQLNSLISERKTAIDPKG